MGVVMDVSKCWFSFAPDADDVGGRSIDWLLTAVWFLRALRWTVLLKMLFGGG